MPSSSSRTASGRRRRISTARSSRSRPIIPTPCTIPACLPISRGAATRPSSSSRGVWPSNPIRRTGTAISALSAGDRLRIDEAIAACRQRDCTRSPARQRLQQPRRAPQGEGRPRRSGVGVSRCDPAEPRAHRTPTHNLGMLLTSQRRTAGSGVCYCKVMTFRPKHPEARRLLALAHCTLGDVDAAVRHFRGMARGGAWQSDRAAHAGGLFRA